MAGDVDDGRLLADDFLETLEVDGLPHDAEFLLRALQDLNQLVVLVFSRQLLAGS